VEDLNGFSDSGTY